MNEINRLLREALPNPMFNECLREAAASVEAELELEDRGWLNLSLGLGGGVSDSIRIQAVKDSRQFYYTDPMAAQAIRLWTDYTFGPGMVWSVDKEKAPKTKVAMELFWDAPNNQSVLSARGQRKTSDRLLVDGEVFFAIFLGSGGQATIRIIDPLEITEIITNPDDLEDVKFYRRQWSDVLGGLHDAIYPSWTNAKWEKDGSKLPANSQVEDALIYHLPFRTLGQRGTSLLLPAHFYLRYNKKFIASRIAIMLALTRFAWKTKIKGGQAAVDAIKAKTNKQEIAAGSQLLENLGSDTTPIKAETGATSAYQDGRMIKLMIAAAVGIPEQYFGDISIGNLATAKTVELPMMKMFQSYQKVWLDTYKDIDNIVFAHGEIPPDQWYVDMDFPAIAPPDVVQAAQAIMQIVQTFPEFADSPDVQQQALMAIGINDPDEVLSALNEAVKRNPDVALTRALKRFKEVLNKKEQ